MANSRPRRRPKLIPPTPNLLPRASQPLTHRRRPASSVLRAPTALRSWRHLSTTRPSRLITLASRLSIPAQDTRRKTFTHRLTHTRSRLRSNNTRATTPQTRHPRRFPLVRLLQHPSTRPCLPRRSSPMAQLTMRATGCPARVPAASSRSTSPMFRQVTAPVPRTRATTTARLESARNYEQVCAG